jgi:hypothetical protein
LLPFFFNLDRYRPEVISYFEENTGKKVEIGRLALTFFPSVTIHIDGFGVKSPPQGFLTNTFARFEGAKLKDGKLSFPFRIDGTIESPKFSKGSSK